jgi:hypothetical protein
MGRWCHAGALEAPNHYQVGLGADGGQAAEVIASENLH